MRCFPGNISGSCKEGTEVLWKKKEGRMRQQRSVTPLYAPEVSAGQPEEEK